MGAKRLTLIGVVAIAVLIGVFLLKPPSGKATLRLCTWSDYYPESLLKAFTEKTGIPVELSYISSNEELLAKYKAGATGFDLIQPSDYMIRQMVKLDMLSPMDHRLLPNLKHLDEFWVNLPYDPGLKHSVPFTWGTTGLTINTKKITIPAEGVSWALLLQTTDPKHTALLDDMREVFATVFFLKGIPINSTDEKNLEMANQQIAQLKPNILMFTGEPRPLLEKGELNIAQTYSADGIKAAAANPDLAYFIPKEGATLWTDNFAIPKSGTKLAEAHAFIDFFLEPENAMKLAMEGKLATPNKTARFKLPPAQTNNPALYPPREVMQKLQMMDDLGDSLQKINRMWTELKSS